MSSARNDNGEKSYDQDLEQLATGVSEMVLKSPTITPSSKLSADAPEFVPSWMKTTTSTSQQQPSNFAGVVFSSTAVDNCFEGGQPATGTTPMSEAEMADCVIGVIQMYLAHLQNSPASFDETATEIRDYLINCAYDTNILEAVIDVIFRAGLEFENFSYQCARLCSFLTEHYYSYTGTDPQATAVPLFRNLLMGRCQAEHLTRFKGPLPGLYNYGLLLADLYNQIKVESRCVKKLGEAVMEIIDALLSEPNNGHVACVVRILKCCGPTLEKEEKIDNGGGDTAPTPKLNSLFAKLEQFLGSPPPSFTEDAKMLIRNLLHNRNDWHKYSGQSGDGYQQPASDFDPRSSDMVYFGPDGEALTAEEEAFLEQELGALQSSSSEDESAFATMFYNTDDDGMDEAYEQFLRMTEEKKRQQQRKN